MQKVTYSLSLTLLFFNLFLQKKILYQLFSLPLPDILIHYYQ